jgi:membrane peptidoglycan carboxypeptidase
MQRLHHLRKKQWPWKKIAWYTLGGGVLFGALLVVYMLFLFQSLPSLEQIGARQVAESTKIYDREGKVLLYEISGGEKRTVVSLKDIPQYVKDSTIVIEDENFYNESGVSIRGILRAFFTDVVSGGIVQGGSTITQQLAKNAFLSREQTIARKLKEFMLAIQLDRHYSKDQILESYLNEVPYGLTTYGVQSASQAYFGKSVQDISLSQSAILAALLQAPSRYSPWGAHRDELFARQKLVLQKMRDAGKISPAQLSQALAEKIVFVPPSNGIRAPHFVLGVQDYLV